jgi:PST family polysaccharide transporter
VSALSNARWIGISQAVRVLLQIAGLLVLSRLLKPSDYGLVAMATIVTNLANVLRDLGTSAAVIQKKELDDETTLSAFWFSNILGLALGVILAATAPITARFLHATEVIPILLLLSLTFPLSSLGTVSQALLERESQFIVVTRIEVVSSVLAFLVAVGAALLGAGPYSLVAQSLVGAALSTIQLLVATRWRPRWHFRMGQIRALWHFGGNLAAFNMVNYLSRNADSLVIGRYLGATPLGVYSLAYRIMLFPVQNMSWISGRALFPVMSRAQDSPELLGPLFLRVLSVIMAVAAPLMGGLYILRILFVHVVLGNQWMEVAPVLGFLAPTGLIQSAVSSTGTVFMARGRTRTLFYLGILGAVLNVSAFLIGIRWGVLGVANCYLIANVLNLIPTYLATTALLELRFLQIMRAVAIPISLSCAMMAIVELIQESMAAWALPGPARLGILIAAGGASYGFLSWLINRNVFFDLLRLAGIRRFAATAASS